MVRCFSKDSLARHLTCIGVGGGPRGFCRLLVQRFCQWCGLAPGPLVTSGPGAGVYWKNIDLFQVLDAAWLLWLWAIDRCLVSDAFGAPQGGSLEVHTYTYIYIYIHTET